MHEIGYQWCRFSRHTSVACWARGLHTHGRTRPGRRGRGRQTLGREEVRKTIYCTVCGAVAMYAVAIHVACRYIQYVWCHQVMRGVINVGRRQYGLVALRGYTRVKVTSERREFVSACVDTMQRSIFSGRCLKCTFHLLYCFERDKVVFWRRRYDVLSATVLWVR